MQRRTKIVATLGPATNDKETLLGVISAGVDIVRLNFSHGVAEDHINRAKLVRECSAEVGRPVGILVDLQGPKIRIDKFADGPITLNEGDKFILDAGMDPNAGTQERVGVTYKVLPKDVKPGDDLLLDDGRLELQVEKVEGDEIFTVVTVPGILSNNKGINLRGGGLSAPAITEKDKADILTAAKIDCDYLAISFPRGPEDVHQARKLMEEAGGQAGIISKVERFEALEAIDEVIIASDGVMVARGDLGVEIGDAELPAAQKKMIRLARDYNRVVITATQMMESMIENPIPTRAEVFDVANAVLDGTDAVMLSAETAAGKHPVKVIEAVNRICVSAEKNPEATTSSHRLNTRFERVDETIAMSTMYAANHLNVKAIIALTESGSTALTMSRISSAIPIYALTRNPKTIGRAALFRGVLPILQEQFFTDHATANKMAIAVLEEAGEVQNGDLVIITKGDLMGSHGSTNAMKIVKVGELVEPGASA